MIRPLKLNKSILLGSFKEENLFSLRCFPSHVDVQAQLLHLTVEPMHSNALQTSTL
jgi:hypothetical protein